MKGRWILFLTLLTCVKTSALFAGPTATATATPTAKATAVLTATETPKVADTATDTPTPAITATLTPNYIPTPVQTPVYPQGTTVTFTAIYKGITPGNTGTVVKVGELRQFYVVQVNGGKGYPSMLTETANGVISK